MAGALSADILLCHLHTTAVADDSLVSDALVFSATALIVLGRTKNTFTEETVALRLVSAIVDCLGLGHLAIGVLKDFLGRGESDSYLGEVVLNFCIFLESHVYTLF